MQATDQPTEHDAAWLVSRQLGSRVVDTQRYLTGRANFVYRVQLCDGRQVVARLNRRGRGAHFAASAAWLSRLSALGLPVPDVLSVDARPADESFPSMLLTWLPGRDLGEVYADLSSAERATLAGQIVAIQRTVSRLPRGHGYGFGQAPDDPALRSAWPAVLMDQLARSRQAITTAGTGLTGYVARVERLVPAFARELAHVEPICFLDDTTTKNVLVHQGRLSGLVDVDGVCYGDPLLTVALTNMSLLNRGLDTDYVDAWCAALALPTARRPLLTLYTALFAVDFMSELGQTANQPNPAPVDRQARARLTALADGLLRDLNG